MKKTLLLSLLSLFIFAGKTMAQYPGMGAVYSQMNQNFINQQMHSTMMMHMMLGNNRENPTYTFTVAMKDSAATREVRSKILFDTVSHKSYIEYTNKDVRKDDPQRKQKIYADQTKYIARTNAQGLKITGMANDSVWLFKVVPGPIAAYSIQADQPIWFNKYSVVAMQYKDGPVEKLDSANLKKVIAADPKAMKLFEKKRYFDALEKFNKNAPK